MVATRDIERMLASNNADTTNISNLKVVPPVTEIDFPNPSPEFGMETRDEQVLNRSSRSDRRSKRDDGSFAAAISRTDKSGENASSSTNLKKRHTSASNSNRRRERSQTCENLSKIYPDCATGAFDYTPIEPNAGCNDESSGASNFPCQASASSKLLGTTTSSTTVPVNNVTKKSPKKMKGISPMNIVSPKKMTTNDTDATAAEPTIIGNAKVYSRSLIPPKVYQSSATGLWISTVNTASNSSDDMKAFSFRTEQEARASAYANAPPMMIPFDTCSQCMLCDVKFTLLRRRKSCRNCGICICSNYSCSTKWRAKMVPETYNVKKTSTVKVCTSCDSLAKRFQHSLLEGRYETAVELYLTGNINLRVPFAFKSEKEDMLPVHCAIKGKSEKLIRWLVETQCCPLQMIATSNKTSKSSKGKEMENYLPSLKTSKGKSILDLAMESKDSGILRFLVKEKDLSVFEVKDLDIVLKAMDTLLKEEPTTLDESTRSKANGSKTETKKGTCSSAKDKSTKVKAKSATANDLAEKVKAASRKPPVATFPYDSFNFNADEDSDEEDEARFFDSIDDHSVCTTRPDVCIICSEKNIDCVAAPCGHQMCCLKCSSQLRYCPVCNTGCQFISIYQP